MTKSYFQKDILDSDELVSKSKQRLRYNLILPKKWELVGLYGLVVGGAFAFMTAILFLYSIFNPFFIKTLMGFIGLIVVFFLFLVPILHFSQLQELQVSGITPNAYGTKTIKEFVNFNYITVTLAAVRVILSVLGIIYQIYSAYNTPSYFNIETVTYFIVLIFFFLASLPETIYYIYCIRFFSKQIKKDFP